MSKTVSLLSTARLKHEQGDAAGAERLYRQCLAESPGNLPATRALGELLLDAVRLQEAHAVIAPATRTHPHDADLQVLLGRCLHAGGQVGPAAQIFEAVSRRYPSNIAARAGLARCHTAGQRAVQAVAMLEPLLASCANDPQVRSAMGQACFTLGRREEAVAHLRAAAALKPTANAHADLGWALYSADQPDESLSEFEAALALNPQLGLAVAGKSSVLIDRGQSDEARRAVHSALDAGVLDLMLVTSFARLAKTPDDRAAARRFLDKALAHPHMGQATRATLLLARGSLDESDGNYDAAFEAFRSANGTMPPFDAAGMERSAAEIMRVYDRQTMDRLPRASTPDPVPIFIVGMPRSGTSLVEQILATHPEVHGAGELDDMANLARSIPAFMAGPSAMYYSGTPPYPACVLSITQEQIDQLSRRHLEMLHRLGGPAKRVTDKMPLNFVYLGLIELLFPAARVIHCMRHPLDTCLSCYATPLGQVHGYRARLRDLAAVYRAYRSQMDHWRATLRIPIVDVNYEDLVAEPERETRRLIEFVGLPWDDRCLRFHENRRVVRTASTDQVRRPIYNSSVNRWKHYERHLGELIEGLRGLY